jgi:hypothetical protein
MFANLSERPRQPNDTRRDYSLLMATQTKKTSKAKAQSRRATTEAKKSASATASASKRAVAAEKPQVQSVAEAAVDLPVGVVLSVSGRVSELVEPWTGRTSAERQIKAYRTELRKSLKRTERRGASARRKATSEARKTRNRVEREARKRQRSVESSIKHNRNEVERRVRRVLDEQANRAQDLVGTVTDQFASIR